MPRIKVLRNVLQELCKEHAEAQRHARSWKQGHREHLAELRAECVPLAAAGSERLACNKVRSEEVDSLEAQVQQQFAGDDQAGRQNYFAKTLNSLAYGSRRSGQAKSY